MARSDFNNPGIYYDGTLFQIQVQVKGTTDKGLPLQRFC